MAKSWAQTLQVDHREIATGCHIRGVRIDLLAKSPDTPHRLHENDGIGNEPPQRKEHERPQREAGLLSGCHRVSDTLPLQSAVYCSPHVFR